MIAFIKGNILSKKPTEIVVDVNGIGYLLKISINTFEKISESTEVELHTQMIVREDALELFGFHSLEEKALFNLLVSISGIGPRLALNILSGINSGELVLAITEGNIARISAVPGIGKKTAQRMIMELKDKVNNVTQDKIGEDRPAVFTIRQDAISALLSLGYNQKIAEKTIAGVLENNSEFSVEELIKSALVILNK